MKSLLALSLGSGLLYLALARKAKPLFNSLFGTPVSSKGKTK